MYDSIATVEVVERYMAETWPHHADGTPFARLCRAEHRQGFDCELEAGHDGPHRYTSGGSSIAWSTKIEEDTP